MITIANRILIFLLFLAFTSCEKNEAKSCLITGSIEDERDGQTYQTVKIGNQVWMAENLNYHGTGTCYENQDSLCNIYGRLYTWKEIINNESIEYNQANINGICPLGYHIPSIQEWREMIQFAGGYDNAKYKLLNSELWEYGESFELTNEFEFNILPSGHDFPSFNTPFWGLGLNTKLISSSYAGDTTKNWIINVSIFNGDFTFQESRRSDSPIISNLYCLRCLKDCE